MKSVAVLTPTYNRAHTLETLYESLLKQTCRDFTWYIVDDGSTDSTEKLVKNFADERVNIVYVKKTNGGKHTAINEGLKYIKEPLTFVVDSDDFLDKDAIDTIVRDWKEYEANTSIAGLSYYRLFTNGKIVGDPYPSKDALVDTYANMRINKNIRGDKAEVFRTAVLHEHTFPVFEGEKFLSEAVVWNAIAKKGLQMVYIPKGIYSCEYLPGGLTARGRKYRLQNPQGTMEHAKSFLYADIRYTIRMKYMLLYAATRPFAEISVKEAWKKLEGYKLDYLLCLLPGELLSKCWKIKYKL